MTSSDRLHLISVEGARPKFMKIASIVRALQKHGGFRSTLFHTGQRYDVAMKEAFFIELDIPQPDVDLGIGSGTHAVQTAELMPRFEPDLERFALDAVLVVGDVNSTLACTLVAAKRGVPVVHVEAGLRSFDWAMPEEINRVLTDRKRSAVQWCQPVQAASATGAGSAGAGQPLRRCRVTSAR